MPRPPRTPRGRASHSREQIVGTAIAILDREGPKGLTLRGLAAELGGGLGSVYWYVESKDQLVALACDELIGRALTAAGVDGAEPDPGLPAPPMEVDLGTDDPTLVEAAAAVRRISLAVFAEMDRHPWLAGTHTQVGGERPNDLRLWEHLGRPLAAMGLSPRQQFHGSTAVMGYVVGVSAAMAAQGEGVEPDPTLTKEEHLAQMAARWQQPEYDELSWLRSMSDEFAHHDDVAQFAAGLDLLILGLVRQAQEG